MNEVREITGYDLLDAADEALEARRKVRREQEASEPYSWGYYGQPLRDDADNKEKIFEEKLRMFVLQEVRNVLRDANVPKS